VLLKDTNLSFSERTNFQKLRYWGLVGKVWGPGAWRITQSGELFLCDLAAARERVVTFRGERIRYEGKLIKFKDVTGYQYDRREDYARVADPIKGKGKQLSMI